MLKWSLNSFGIVTVLLFSCKSRNFSELPLATAKSEKGTSSSYELSRCKFNEPVSGTEKELNPLLEVTDKTGAEFDLTEIPDILRYKRPPPLEEFLSSKSNPFLKEIEDKFGLGEKTYRDGEISELPLSIFLAAFKQFPINAHYYFVGGSGYVSSLVARGLFKGTSAEKRFLPLLLSRGSIREAYNQEKHFPFFDTICLQQMIHPHVMLIDSFNVDTESVSASNRSNVQLAMKMRDYLSQVAGFKNAKANLSIVPAGPLEEPATNVPAARSSWQSYLASAKKIGNNQETSIQIFLEFPRYFFDFFLNRLYRRNYWTGDFPTYDNFDERYLPTNFAAESDAKLLLNVYNERRKIIEFYVNVYFSAVQYGKEHTEIVQAIAKKMETVEDLK